MYTDTVHDFLRAFNAKNSLRCLKVLSEVVTEDFPAFASETLQVLRKGLYSPEESFPAVRNMGIASAANLMKACLSPDYLIEPEILSAVAVRCEGNNHASDDFYNEERETANIEALRRGASLIEGITSPVSDAPSEPTDLGSFIRSVHPTQKVVS